MTYCRDKIGQRHSHAFVVTAIVLKFFNLNKELIVKIAQTLITSAKTVALNNKINNKINNITLYLKAALQGKLSLRS